MSSSSFVLTPRSSVRSAVGSSLGHVIVWMGGQGGAQHLRQVVHDAGLLGVDQVEFPDEDDEMCVQCVQVSLQLQSHRLFKVRPVNVRQHVEQISTDLLHQRLERVGKVFAWKEIEIVSIFFIIDFI